MDLIFRPREGGTSPSPVDMSRLVVEARALRTRSRVIALGEHTRVTPGAGTLLDVDYGEGGMAVRGRAEIA